MAMPEHELTNTILSWQTCVDKHNLKLTNTILSWQTQCEAPPRLQLPQAVVRGAGGARAGEPRNGNGCKFFFEKREQ